MQRHRAQELPALSSSIQCLPNFGWSSLWNPITLRLPYVSQAHSNSELIVQGLKEGTFRCQGESEEQSALSGPSSFRNAKKTGGSTLNISVTSPPSLSCSDVTEDPLLTLKAIEANPFITRALLSNLPRRPRSEKKPIPSDQKDQKYFERRKRNNLAAKKSRDARKAREDEVALRACFLEKENAILRAQVATLREEAHSLRHLLLQRRHRLC
ncbi:uncharacterized protein LOC143231892 [Tachypleus tridentatus]|uniref:uncharacterized protein LOC143231892 n=1 Tax=Tachypleus tridentatus TaxID=6853 RepID=UPI003FD038BC